jgi:hypothetical protein
MNSLGLNMFNSVEERMSLELLVSISGFSSAFISQAYDGFIVWSILSSLPISARWIRKSYPDLSTTYSFFNKDLRVKD